MSAFWTIIGIHQPPFVPVPVARVRMFLPSPNMTLTLEDLTQRRQALQSFQVQEIEAVETEVQDLFVNQGRKVDEDFQLPALYPGMPPDEVSYAALLTPMINARYAELTKLIPSVLEERLIKGSLVHPETE